MAWLKTRRLIEKEKLDKRASVVTDLEEGLKLYKEIAKAWLVKSIKHPLISIIKDPALNLNFLTTKDAPQLAQAEIQTRLMKARVRLKGILKGVLE